MGTLLLAVLVGLVVWQSSFSFGDFGPASPEGILVVWGVSTQIFILTVTLGFMLARNFVKSWVDRHRNREGSRIRTKLVLGALVLTITPVLFLVLFSIGVLNRNLENIFSHVISPIKVALRLVGPVSLERSRCSPPHLRGVTAARPHSFRPIAVDKMPNPNLRLFQQIFATKQTPSTLNGRNQLDNEKNEKK